MWWNIIFALVVAAGLWLLLWWLRGMMLLPLRLGKNQRLDLVLTVSGESQELEYTVNCLLWLIENGTLRGQLVLRDAGMDERTRQTAELLHRRGSVKLIH